jgi:alanine racemase
LEVFRRLCGEATPIWIVKANAYGHGAALLASEIEKTIVRGRGEWFGVDSIDEGVALRKEGIRAPIIVLGWVPYPRLSELVKNNLRYLVSSERTVKELAKLKNKKGLRAHLKIDTGATRQGVLPAGALKLAKSIKSAGMTLEGVATHFANIEDVDNPTYADLQLERFTATVALLRRNGFSVPIVHAACTAAVMTRLETIFTAARVGIGLYGLNPSALINNAFRKRHRGLELRPVLSWRSRVALVKSAAAGTPVGYGLTERVKKDSTIAVVPVGYADGYDRSLSSRGAVLVRGRRARVIGRICMNMFMIDVTGIRGVKENDVVTLIGEDRGKKLSADDLSGLSDTIAYEIVARLPAGIKRLVV